MDNITFHGKSFPLKEIELPQIGKVLISTSLLNSRLMNNDGSYYSEKARIMDEDIYFYVEPNEINFSNELLSEILK